MSSLITTLQTLPDSKISHMRAICEFYGEKKIRRDQKFKQLFPQGFFELLAYYQEHIYRKAELDIYVISASGKYNNVLYFTDVPIDKTIRDVKKIVAKSIGVVPNALYKKRKKLDDQDSLIAYGICEGDHKIFSAIICHKDLIYNTMGDVVEKQEKALVEKAIAIINRAIRRKEEQENPEGLDVS